MGYGFRDGERYRERLEVSCVERKGDLGLVVYRERDIGGRERGILGVCGVEREGYWGLGAWREKERLWMEVARDGAILVSMVLERERRGLEF